jgi:hypothetical protein
VSSGGNIAAGLASVAETTAVTVPTTDTGTDTAAPAVDVPELLDKLVHRSHKK